MVNPSTILAHALLCLLVFLPLCNASASLMAPLLEVGSTFEGTLNPGWVDRSDEEEHFRIQWRPSGQSIWQDLAIQPANFRAWTAGGLPAEASYDFRVRAEAGAGASDWSNIASATTQPAGYGKRPGFLSSQSGPTSETGWSAFLQFNPNGSTTTVSAEYGLTSELGQTVAASSTIGPSGSYGYTSVNLSGLTPGTRYFFRLIALNASGTYTGYVSSFVTNGATAPLPPGIVNKGILYRASDSATVDTGIYTGATATVVVVEYGPTSALGSATEALHVDQSNFEAPVKIALGGLTPATSYYYRVAATNGAGTTTGATLSFTTLEAPPPSNEPVVIPGVVTGITSNGALINATVNPNGASTLVKVEYGTTSALGLQATANVASGTSPVAVTVPLTGLTPYTTWYYRIGASSTGGAVSGVISSFKTAGVPAVPQIGATSVYSIRLDYAFFDVRITPNGSPTAAVVEYGTTQALGQTSASRDLGSGFDSVPTLLSLEGLSSDTLYYYRVKATNGTGAATGAIQSVRTLAPTIPPSIATPAGNDADATSATVGASIKPNGSPTSFRIEYGTSEALGQTSDFFAVGAGAAWVPVSAGLAGLSADTLYYYRVLAFNGLGLGVSVTRTFRTAANAEAPTIAPPPDLELVSTSPVLSASINPKGLPTSYTLEYGATSSLGQSTDPVSIGTGAATAPASVTLDGLSVNTQYYYRFSATSSAGTTFSAIASFKTSGGIAPSLSLPQVAFITATGAGISASAYLNGSTQSTPTLSVQYGTTPDLGQVASGSPYVFGGGSATLAGLTPATLYYYRFQVSNSKGTNLSAIATFTTAPASLPPDAPSISTPAVSGITAASATISASINPKGSATTIIVEYGTTQALGLSTTPASLGSGTAFVTASASLSRLSPGTLYYYRLSATNAAGATASVIDVFTTQTNAAPPAVSAVNVDQITATSARVSASINPKGSATTFVVEYGTTQALGLSTTPASLGSGTAFVTASASLSLLSPGTLYYYRLSATNEGGATASAIDVFTTQTNATPPAVSALNVDQITATSARVSASINPKGRATTFFVEYGTTPALGLSTTPASLGSGTAFVTASAALSGLSPAMHYYYRVSATNAGGATASVIDVFTTQTNAAPPAVSAVNVDQITATSARVSASINPKGSATSVVVEYGATSALGQSTAAADIGSGSSAIPGAFTLGGLTPETRYYYRFKATSFVGTTASALETFKTVAPATGSLSANSDVAFTVPGRSVTCPVLANDSSSTGDALQLVSVSKPSAGSVRLNQNGTLTYTPGAKFSSLDTFAYKVADQHGNSQVATVAIYNASFSAAGRFASLLGDMNGDFTQTGAIQVSIAATGVITGKLSLAGTSYSFRSRMNADGSAVAIVPRPGTSPVVITMLVDLFERSMTGSVTAGAVTVAFTGYRAPFRTLNNAAPMRGRYTLLLPYDDAALPQVKGVGAATMNVSAAGEVRIVGRTAAGAPFSASSDLLADGRFPLYSVVTAPRRTSFHGWMKFRHVEGTCDLDGQLGWSAAAAGNAVVTSTLIGSAYVPPVGSHLALPFPAGDANARLDFWSGQEHLTPAPPSVTLKPAALVSLSPAVQMPAFDLVSGRFSGHLSVAGKLRAFMGVVFQAQGLGAGVLSGTDGSAAVQLVDPATAASPDNTGVKLVLPPQ